MTGGQVAPFPILSRPSVDPPIFPASPEKSPVDVNPPLVDNKRILCPTQPTTSLNGAQECYLGGYGRFMLADAVSPTFGTDTNTTPKSLIRHAFVFLSLTADLFFYQIFLLSEGVYLQYNKISVCSVAICLMSGLKVRVVGRDLGTTLHRGLFLTFDFPLPGVAVLRDQGVEMVLRYAHSCCSGDRLIVNDKGIVYSPHTKERAGDELRGSVVQFSWRDNQSVG
jgi:hypothetical protein